MDLKTDVLASDGNRRAQLKSSEIKLCQRKRFVTGNTSAGLTSLPKKYLASLDYFLEVKIKIITYRKKKSEKGEQCL